MASANILLRSGENRAVLDNGMALRSVNIGTAWTQIRAGILCQPNSIATLASLDFALGFCAGTANAYGDATTDHFVGLGTNSSWTFSGGNLSALTLVPMKRVGTSRTLGTSLATNCVAHATPGTDFARGIFIVDITKGSPNYSFRVLYRNALNTTDNPTEAQFIANMTSAAPTQSRHAYAAAQTLAVDEGADGVLDTFQMFWAPSGNTLEVSAVAVSIIA